MKSAKEVKEITEQIRNQKQKKYPTKRALKKIEKFILKAAKQGETSASVLFANIYWNTDEIISELRKAGYVVNPNCQGGINIHWS